MCGRYVHPDQAAIERGWHIGRSSGMPFERRYNVAPTTRVPMLRWDAASQTFELSAAFWGFVPVWWKEERLPRHTINARTEEIHRKPMWRGAYRQARCLLPALGWYEWQARERVDTASGEVVRYKQPCFIRPLDDGLMCFAALWSPRVPQPGVAAASCTILTRASAGVVAPVHDRMPVVLDEAGMAAWVDPAVTDPDAVIAAHAREDFGVTLVSTRVNQARAEGEQLIEAVGVE